MTVDDSASMRQMVTLALESAGFEVVQAVDGQDALARLQGRDIHLFLADLNMPNMDGIELTRQLRTMCIQIRSHCAVDHRIARG